MNSNRDRWAFGTLLGILTGMCATVRAQEAPPEKPAASDSQLQEVIVTGTSIRGATAPVGSNLITVGREEIEASGAQTLPQILRSVPAVTGFGNSGQGVAGQGGGGAGGFQSFDGAGTYTPTLHGLGASSSNGTLILIDGHRLPLTGINHTLADPSVIAPLAIERVEILPDGASSVYGSDAVAGVLNFITRRRYNGFEATSQASFADGYSAHNVGALYGTSGDFGSIIATYNYSKRNSLSFDERSFTAADHRAQGGGNFSNFNCAPASVSPAAGQPSAGLVFAYPYNGAGIANTAANGFCDFTGVQDLLPEDERHNFLLKFSKDVNEQLYLTTDLVYSKQTNVTQITRGSVLATVYGPGSTPPGGAGQINPFFQAPAGVNVATVRFQGDDLFGPGAQFSGGAESLFGTFSATYEIKGTWVASFDTTIGQDDSRQRRDGVLCSSCALMALNGTTNSGGNPTTPSVPGTTTAVLTLPLSSANALDVWSPSGSNPTSAALRNQILDSAQLQTAHQTIRDYRLKFDGELFNLPGGAVSAAVGTEYIEYTMSENVARERNTGPASLNSATTFLNFDRDVKSAFLEFLIPLVGTDNTFIGVRRLDLSLSGRRDDYSDFGSTNNPRYALTWEPMQGLSIRGNFARSFTAPALTSRGNAQGITAESSFGGLLGATGSGVNANQAVPNTYPGAIGLPGCTASTPTCFINTASVPGVFIAGGNKDLQPQKGKTYSVGFDVTPSSLPGFRFSATWWNAEYLGAITAPQAAFAIGAPALSSLLQLLPGGATPEQIAAAAGGRPQTAPLPSTAYFIYSFQQQNAFNLKANGIDADVSYRFNTGFGDFNMGLAASRKLKMDQQFGTGGATFSVLNTVGINTTFPSNKMAARANLGWTRSGVSAELFANYSGAYLNWTGSAPYPVVRDANFSPVGGGQEIPSFTTVDMHAAYDFGKEGALSGVQVFLDGSNILDKDPPFYNAGLGFDGFNASPLGRMMTVGLSKKW